MKPPPPVPWSILKQETLYQDSWRTLRRDRLRLHTGEESDYVFLETAAAAFVVPQLEDGRIALLRQYRHPLRAWVWEVPAGSLEPGETPAAAAARELAEEIGGRARTWRRLGAFPTAVAHVVDHTTYLLAQGVVLGEAKRELHEVAELHAVHPEDALRLARGDTPAAGGSVMSAHSALALLLAEPHLGVKRET
ncbi:MAG: NUDIX hydrolase [Chloroflexi bacterium]|nr:NUDIX hydrolase [Chloroflexota bacterium]